MIVAATTNQSPVATPHVIEIRLVIDLRLPGQDAIPQKIEIPIQASVPNVVPSAIPFPTVFNPAAVSVVTNSRSLPELYNDLLSSRDIERRVSEKTQKDNLSALSRFEDWLRSQHQGGEFDSIAAMQAPNVMRNYAEHLRMQPKGNSASMCSKALTTIGKLTAACVKAGLMKARPESLTKSAVNMIRPRSERQRRIKAVPVTVEELKAMLSVVDGCRWPKFGSVSASHFWYTSLLSHYVYGFRSQDWFACRTADKKGLLWSGIVSETECPVVEGLHNEAGWVWYLVHKTSKKDEAAERPADVLAPLHPEMREAIERFRGVDAERVFPLANNSSTYSKEFAALLARAGLSDQERIAAGKPIIRLSLGQRDVASFRKGASAMWAKYAGRPAASYMLHHAVAEEGVAKMTAESYLQNEQVLREITAQMVNLPVWGFRSLV